MTVPSSANNLAGMSLDLNSLNSLKTRAATDPKAAISGAAKQLESLFMQELMKSMRATTMDSGMLENSGSQMGTEMLDTEFATRMSGLPGGLSQAITKQLERSMLAVDAKAAGAATGGQAAAQESGTLPLKGSGGARGAANKLSTHLTHQQAFVKEHQEAAHAAEAATGIPAANLIGQAAHETGWGRHQIRNKDGTPSHNLFGIKAGADWKGKVAEVTTTEYINGVPRRVTAKFRSYDSYAEAFTDHAKLLTSSARYAKVVEQGDTAKGYATSLQRAGYATDPAYADKLTRVINTTLRLQRAVT